MNKEDLTKKLNEMLVGKSAYNMYKLCDYVRDHITDLGIDNTQGEYGVRLGNHTITIAYKTYSFVSFDIKRQAHNEYRWVVKQVIVDENFIDLETRLAYIHNRYKEEIKNYNRLGFRPSNLEELKDCLKVIKQKFTDKTKLDIKLFLYDLINSYWLVDEALESEGE